MTTQPYPAGFHSVNPYLVVTGVAALITFLEVTFNTVERRRVLRPDGTIAHAEVSLGDSVIEMGEPDDTFLAQPGALHVYVEDTDATYQRALRAGATSLYESADMPYGERGAGVRDACGNQWYIATVNEGATTDH